MRFRNPVMLKYSLGIWIALSVGLIIVLSLSFPSSKSFNANASVFLPGRTTHGHHQIEMQCTSCHDPFGGVQDDACLKCHQEELKASRDTHPKSKFDDPAKAVLLEKINAQHCLTCHKEHVPGQTHPMGVTVPLDYCLYCHEGIAEERPSHKGLAFQSCSASGCHNYHDNTALYEKFLTDHADEPNVRSDPRLPVRSFVETNKALNITKEDVPDDQQFDHLILADWTETMHARAGVNCMGCHKSESSEWMSKPGMETCKKCHEGNVESFLQGLHGMRLASGLSPLMPRMAELPMKPHSLHSELNCMACHDDHRFDTQFAAADACLTCHNDRHSLAYNGSSHEKLWRDELSGKGEAGTGVSCASCHMPREEKRSGVVTVSHNQNATLEPNEKMIRSVCINCHGLQFTLDSLADRKLIDACFSTKPNVDVESIRMAVERMNSRRKPK